MRAKSPATYPQSESSKTFTLRSASRALGAEVIGLDLSQPIDDETVAALRSALAEFCVLAFRDQQITPEQHVNFSRRFGDLEYHVLSDYLLHNHPEIYVLSNVKENGKARGRAGAGQYWHSDLSYVKEPSLGSIMYAVEVPDTGGDTMFASMYRAYDALSETMQQFLDGLRAVHDFAYTQRTYIAPRNRTTPASAEQLAKTPPVEHPVIRVHPESGRKAIYVNPGMTTQILGLSETESRAILKFLFAHTIRPEFVYRHRWRTGDVVFWDNRCSMHCAIDDYDDGDRRLMHRTTIKGDAPR